MRINEMGLSRPENPQLPRGFAGGDRTSETAENAKILGLENIQTATPESVPDELMFSGIWSNPPILIGKKELHKLLQSWLPRLEKNGSAYLVVQKNLGSDSLQKWLTETLVDGYEVSRLTSVKTYRILKVLRTA